MALLAFLPAVALASEAAPDPTPLLFDRVQKFPAVVIATLDDGFEKNCEPQPSTNCVFLVVKVEKVLKADKDGMVKVGPLPLSVHGELPKLLAARDKAGPRRYLLALSLSKTYGYLGSAHLYGDLERFFPADAAMEKVVDAFAKADDKHEATLKVLAGLLADRTMTDAAARHVYEQLRKLIAVVPFKSADGKAVNIAEMQACADSAVAAIKGGRNVPSGAAMLTSLRCRTDAADVKFDNAPLAEAIRKWLDATSTAKADPARPDWQAGNDMASAIELLVKLADKSAKGVLVKIGKDNRWATIRPKVIAAIREIHGPEAEAILKDLPQPPPIGPRMILD
ncbi:MAG: hypothetical protein PHU85_10135 [Phycisphaerae bacterium]|nr:hypothetical protein [Phycisphaerae bacterium]